MPPAKKFSAYRANNAITTKPLTLPWTKGKREQTKADERMPARERLRRDLDRLRESAEEYAEQKKLMDATEKLAQQAARRDPPPVVPSGRVYMVNMSSTIIVAALLNSLVSLAEWIEGLPGYSDAGDVNLSSRSTDPSVMERAIERVIADVSRQIGVSWWNGCDKDGNRVVARARFTPGPEMKIIPPQPYRAYGDGDDGSVVDTTPKKRILGGY